MDALNELEVFESTGGEEAYALVYKTEEVIEDLHDVGISKETIDKYGDEETFCILALAFSEGFANWYDGTKLTMESNEITFLTDILDVIEKGHTESAKDLIQKRLDYLNSFIE